MSGIDAVLAKSFARIFYRNSINVGLPAIICNTSSIDEGDELEIDIIKGTVIDKSKNIELTFSPFPSLMNKILLEGGLVPYIKKHGMLKAD